MACSSQQNSLSSTILNFTGSDKVNDADDEESSVATLIAAVYIAQILANCESDDLADYEGRVKRLRSAVEERSIPKLELHSIERVAKSGFTVTDDCNTISCPSCKENVDVSKLDSNLLKQHASSCAYPLLCSSKLSNDVYQREPLKDLIPYLRREWSSTKVAVALEIYPAGLIATGLVCYFLQQRRLFSAAGELVDYLYDLELRSSPVLWEVSPITRALKNVKQDTSSSIKDSSNTNTYKESNSIAVKAANERTGSIVSPHTSIGRSPLGSSPTTFNTKNSLLEETMKLVYKWRCKNCGKMEADQLLADCGHLALCSTCRPKLSSCPICQVSITDSIRVYAA